MTKLLRDNFCSNLNLSGEFEFFAAQHKLFINKMPVEISLLAEKVQNLARDDAEDTNVSHQIVSPGDVITRFE